jgi:DDE superfamily endonuclease
LKSFRNEETFIRNQEIQEFLKKQELEGKFKVYFFDEAGTSLIPNIPYAWQTVGDTIEIPSKRSKRLNILGFMNRGNDGLFHFVESSVKSSDVIHAFDAFSARYAKEYAKTKVPCLVVLDNASIHHSAEFKAQIDGWMAQGICLHYLPTYSPELNLIEILWRKIKYEWMPMSAYKTYSSLTSSVKNIISLFGKKYKIIFA